MKENMMRQILRRSRYNPFECFTLELTSIIGVLEYETRMIRRKLLVYTICVHIYSATLCSFCEIKYL